jgi:hypothetical protein
MIAAWAERVAHDAALAGIRRAVVGGKPSVRQALTDALRLAGIEVLSTLPPPPTRSWLPWKRAPR